MRMFDLDLLGYSMNVTEYIVNVIRGGIKSSAGIAVDRLGAFSVNKIPFLRKFCGLEIF